MGSEKIAEETPEYKVGDKLVDDGNLTWKIIEVNAEEEWLEVAGYGQTRVLTFNDCDQLKMRKTASVKTAAKNSLDLLGVKDQKIKKPFDTEENRTMIDRSPGDSLFGDDKETQGRHITNMKGPGGLKTGMVKKADLSIGDDVLIGESTYKVAEIKSNGIIARHAFTSSDHFFGDAQFNRIASVAFVQGDVTVQEAATSPLFFENKAEAGLFPVGDDDTVPK